MEIPSRKVLLVESDEVIVVLISHLLTRESFLVHSTVDALEAERMLRAERYDAILIEPRTPNATEFLRKLVQRDPALLKKTIVVTSAAQDLDGLRPHTVIQKPFEVFNLVQAVKTVTDPTS